MYKSICTVHSTSTFSFVRYRGMTSGGLYSMLFLLSTFLSLTSVFLKAASATSIRLHSIKREIIYEPCHVIRERIVFKLKSFDKNPSEFDHNREGLASQKYLCQR
eukprot:TRINITY_DN2326_c0_g1_i2.p2 TRINITY_DN2326_c0_g1~~TRINITY_DN2326_c0_g1_i2.p2  ORF type:complete len:105 (+),score=4.01 TRINITY_DN2326_c0_g1_i2:1350-1664(+)